MIVTMRAVVGIFIVLTLVMLRAGASADSIGLRAAPKVLQQLGPEGNVILVTGLAGVPKIRVRDPSIVDVTTPEVTGMAAAFEVRRVAAGATQIEVSDSSGSSISIPVDDIPNCLPPPGHFRLIGREVGRPSLPHEPSHPTKLYFTTDQQPDVSDGLYAVRLIDRDGLVQKGSPPMVIDDSVAIPMVTIKRQPGAHVYISYAETLATDKSYRVWLVRSACEPPYDLGTL